MKTLRPYQQKARQEINRLLNAGKNPVLAMGTGTGKTFTACAIIQDRINLKERVFVLVPQIEIFEQWCAALAQDNIDFGMISADGVQGKNKMVYVCMPLSLANILSKLPEKFKPDIIVTDEAHTGEADTYQVIYQYYPKSKRIGLTATPERTDGRGLKNTYDIIVEPISMKEAIEAGFLSEPLLIVPEQYAVNVDIKDGDYDVREQAALLGDAQIIGDVITQYGNIFAGAPVMVACCSFEHAEKMTAAFNDVGWNFQHIHSNLNKHERAAMIRKIRKREINGLCTVGIGIAGLDIPGLFGLIWLRRTLSVTIYLQFIGRCLRTASGKRYGVILDPVGNVFIHGRPDRVRRWSLEGRADALIDPEFAAPKMKICPVCQVLNAETNTHCHLCNFDFTDPLQKPDSKGRKIPAMVDGELIVLDGEGLSKRKEEIKAALDEQRHERQKAEEKAAKGVELSKIEKMTLLKNGLEKKRGLFSHAVKNYL